MLLTWEANIVLRGGVYANEVRDDEGHQVSGHGDRFLENIPHPSPVFSRPEKKSC